MARKRKENLKEFDWLITLIGVILAGVIASMVQSFSITDKAIVALASALGLYIVFNERDKRRRSKQ